MAEFKNVVFNGTAFSVASICRYAHVIHTSDGSTALEVEGGSSEEELSSSEHTIEGLKVLTGSALKLPSTYPHVDIILTDGFPLDQLAEACARYGEDFADRLYKVHFKDRGQFSIIKPARDFYGLRKVTSVSPPGKYVKELFAGRSPSRFSILLSLEAFKNTSDVPEAEAAKTLTAILDGQKADAPLPDALASDEERFQKIQEGWKDVLEVVREELCLPAVSFNVWVRGLTPTKLCGDTLFVSSENPEDRFYVRANFGLPLKLALKSILGEELNLCWEVDL